MVKDFGKRMVEDHKDMSDFRKKENSDNVENTKNFAAKTLPTLVEH